MNLSIANTTPDMPSAQAAFEGFIAKLDKAAHTVALHDCDADGVPAGVIWQLALERAGFTSLSRVIPDNERNAWSVENKRRVAAAKPKKLFVLDLGSQPVPVCDGVETCLIDHHQPEGIPPGDTLICAYSWEPIPNTSLLIWELCKSLANVDDLDWLAGMGTFNDLGEHAPFEIIAQTKAKYKAKYMKEATAMVNAARRASTYDPEAAAQALLNHDNPRALVESKSSEVVYLREAREEVKAALAEAKKAAPIFAGKVALVRVSSQCQVHPLIAQIWRGRLPKYIVIVANDQFIPGRVTFSVRAAPGSNVLEFLRSIELSDGEGHFGHGHDQASGGSLPVTRWNELLQQLGFPPEVMAQ